MHVTILAADDSRVMVKTSLSPEVLHEALEFVFGHPGTYDEDEDKFLIYGPPALAKALSSARVNPKNRRGLGLLIENLLRIKQ